MIDPDSSKLPPRLQNALRTMSRHAPVVDPTTGRVVARDGRLLDDPAHPLAGCAECARAVAQGWWGAIARHPGPADAPTCALCGEGEATLTPSQWFDQVATLIGCSIAAFRRSWRDDAVAGLGLRGAPTPFTRDDFLHRWPTATAKTELIEGRLVFSWSTAPFDERDVATAQQVYPGCGIHISPEGNLEVQIDPGTPTP